MSIEVGDKVLIVNSETVSPVFLGREGVVVDKTDSSCQVELSILGDKISLTASIRDLKKN